MRTGLTNRVVLALAISAASGSTAAADALENAGTALDFAGFDLIGNRNPLSGGVDLLITNTFSGAPFDFGAADLSLLGPISLQVSTGGRLLSQFDVSLTTAVNNQSTPSALNYVWNSDVGGQSAQVNGSVLINADLSLNGLGFYEIRVDYSSRQIVNRDGRIDTDQTSHDFDLGPITISGNIFTDALALVTDPLFNRIDQPNPFRTVSSFSQLINADPARQQELLESLLASGGESLVFHDAGTGPLSRSLFEGLVASRLHRDNPLTVSFVPEPPVIALLVIGLPVLLGRFRGIHKR